MRFRPPSISRFFVALQKTAPSKARLMATFERRPTLSNCSAWPPPCVRARPRSPRTQNRRFLTQGASRVSGPNDEQRH